MTISFKLALCLVCACLHAPATASAAQQSGLLEPGARVRVRPITTLTNMTGTLVRLERDSIVLGRGPDLLSTVAVADLDWIDVSLGRRRHLGRGAFIGVAVGALVAIGYNAAASAGCTDNCSDKKLPVATYGLVAAMAGAGIGFFIQTDRWSRVHLAPRPPLSLKRNPPFGGGFP